MKKLFRISALLLLVLAACDTAPVEPVNIPPQGLDYMPLTLRHFVSYNVRETRYALNASPQVITYQLKEVVQEQIIASDGTPAWRIVRFRRANGRQNWQVENVWLARKDERRAIRHEDNVPFVKLIFPFRLGIRWDGNALNDQARENYELEHLNKAYIFDGKTYSETATVLQRADSSLVSKDFRQEVYARNIGLIYRKSEQLAFCQEPSRNCLGQGIIDSGLIYEQSIFDTGIELEDTP
jgi:hypothetical protein